MLPPFRFTTIVAMVFVSTIEYAPWLKEKFPKLESSLSWMVSTAVLCDPRRAPPTGVVSARFTVRSALVSAMLLSMMPIAKVWLVTPSPNVRVPTALV